MKKRILVYTFLIFSILSGGFMIKYGLEKTVNNRVVKKEGWKNISHDKKNGMAAYKKGEGASISDEDLSYNYALVYNLINQQKERFEDSLVINTGYFYMAEQKKETLFCPKIVLQEPFMKDEGGLEESLKEECEGETYLLFKRRAKLGVCFKEDEQVQKNFSEASKIYSLLSNIYDRLKYAIYSSFESIIFGIVHTWRLLLSYFSIKKISSLKKADVKREDSDLQDFFPKTLALLYRGDNGGKSIISGEHMLQEKKDILEISLLEKIILSHDEFGENTLAERSKNVVSEISKRVVKKLKCKANQIMRGAEQPSAIEEGVRSYTELIREERVEERRLEQRLVDNMGNEELVPKSPILAATDEFILNKELVSREHMSSSINESSKYVLKEKLSSKGPGEIPSTNRLLLESLEDDLFRGPLQPFPSIAEIPTGVNNKILDDSVVGEGIEEDAMEERHFAQSLSSYEDVRYSGRVFLEEYLEDSDFKRKVEARKTKQKFKEKKYSNNFSDKISANKRRDTLGKTKGTNEKRTLGVTKTSNTRDKRESIKLKDLSSSNTLNMIESSGNLEAEYLKIIKERIISNPHLFLQEERGGEESPLIIRGGSIEGKKKAKGVKPILPGTRKVSRVLENSAMKKMKGSAIKEVYNTSRAVGEQRRISFNVYFQSTQNLDEGSGRKQDYEGYKEYMRKSGLKDRLKRFKKSDSEIKEGVMTEDKREPKIVKTYVTPALLLKESTAKKNIELDIEQGAIKEGADGERAEKKNIYTNFEKIQLDLFSGFMSNLNFWSKKEKEGSDKEKKEGDLDKIIPSKGKKK